MMENNTLIDLSEFVILLYIRQTLPDETRDAAQGKYRLESVGVDEKTGATTKIRIARWDYELPPQPKLSQLRELDVKEVRRLKRQCMLESANPIGIDGMLAMLRDIYKDMDMASVTGVSWQKRLAAAAKMTIDEDGNETMADTKV